MGGLRHHQIAWIGPERGGGGQSGNVGSFPSGGPAQATLLGFNPEESDGRLRFLGEVPVEYRFLYRVDLPREGGLEALSWYSFTVRLLRSGRAYAKHLERERKRTGSSKALPAAGTQSVYLATFPYHVHDRFDHAPLRGGIQRSREEREAWFRGLVDPVFQDEDGDVLGALMQAMARRGGVDWSRSYSQDRVATLGDPVRPAGQALSQLLAPRVRFAPVEVVGVGPPTRESFEALAGSPDKGLEPDPEVAELLRAAKEQRLFELPVFEGWNQQFRWREVSPELWPHAGRLMKASILLALGGPKQGLSAKTERQGWGYSALFSAGEPVANLVREIFIGLMRHLNRGLTRRAPERDPDAALGSEGEERAAAEEEVQQRMGLDPRRLEAFLQALAKRAAGDDPRALAARRQLEDLNEDLSYGEGGLDLRLLVQKLLVGLPER